MPSRTCQALNVAPDDIDPKTKKLKQASNSTGSLGGADFVQVNPRDRRDGVGFRDFYLGDKKARLSKKDKARVESITCYSSRPQSEYQRKLRARGAIRSAPRIHNHTIGWIWESTHRRLYGLEMVPGAKDKGIKARLNFVKHFWTMMNGTFSGGVGNIVHPNQ
ncbi:hypothetical protein BGX23_000702 [Mortierella sp. AD031]|nr:hypothetical protein BGX23_000702 [Mortierella sp. AD031]